MNYREIKLGQNLVFVLLSHFKKLHNSLMDLPKHLGSTPMSRKSIQAPLSLITGIFLLIVQTLN